MPIANKVNAKEMINYVDVIQYINNVEGLSRIERYNSLYKLNNCSIEINLNERPTVGIRENQLGEFFVDYSQRCKFLNSLIGLNWEEEISNMAKYINVEIDEVNIYHYSLFPQKMPNQLIAFDKFYLVNLSNENFERLLTDHTSFGDLIDASKYTEGYRTLLISKEIAKRRNANESHHLHFDRLDEIYSYHSIIRFLSDFFSGNIENFHSSISTDNFPNAGSSQSSRVIKTEVNEIEEDHKIEMTQILAFLKNKLTYRLIIRS